MSGEATVEKLLRILHLEDDSLDAELIAENLRGEGYQCVIQHVLDEAGFRAAVAEEDVDVILADFSLPAFNGMAALHIARELRPNTPFIFVSGAIGEERAIETLKQGATDYVLKDHLSRLAPAIERALSEVAERQRRIQATEELRRSRTELKQLNEELEQRVAERTEALRQSQETTQALLQLSEKLTMTLDPAALLDILIEEAVVLVDAEGGFACHNTPDGLSTSRYFRREGPVTISHLWRAGYGLPGRLLHDRKPYLVNDLSTSAEAAHEFYSRFGVRSSLGTPLLSSHGEVLGCFEVNNKLGGGPFTTEDERKLVAAAQIAAIALQNAQSYRKLQELSHALVYAQEKEQQRLSRELHDSAGQLLTALQIHLTILSSEPSLGPAVRDQVNQAVELTGTLQDEIRAISRGLRPPSVQFENVGLNKTLLHLCEDFAEKAALQLDYQGSDVPPVPDQISINFYRFLQEALNNVVKHAQATRVNVRLAYDGRTLRLEVEDNGVGFPAPNLPLFSIPKGVGLLGLRERFELIGGKILVESAAGRGCRVTALYELQ